MPSNPVQPPFFITRPAKPTVHSLSAAVGSGKTRAALAYIARSAMAAENFVYVAPTIELLKQTAEELRATLKGGGDHRTVTVIHSGLDRAGEPPARSEARRLLNEVEGPEGQILIITTETFLHVLAEVEQPEHWRVILDEAFSPVKFGTFELGPSAPSGWDYFSETFEIGGAPSYLLKPRAGLQQRVKDIAAGRWQVVGHRYEGLQRLAALVANPATRCELIMTDKVQKFLEDQGSPRLPSEAVR
jgi:hypothetical protein